MRVELWAVGKTNETYLETGMAIYQKRLGHYLTFGLEIIPPAKVKTTDGNLMRNEEGKAILSKLDSEDFLVLLDERGKQFTSVEFSKWMEKHLAHSRKRIVFLIGGAFGFSEEVYARANADISLSSMTFSHQMVRLFFLEQLYRAMTILRGERYHNE
jgi:23S rRNA (pseudouridine1915-N3)-methyltransferase